jgi:arylsulfatase A-like enzyme
VPCSPGAIRIRPESPAPPPALDPSIPTLATPFRAAGYHTAWIGKWHVDGSNAREHYIPPERRGGFDHWVGYENNNNQDECYVFGTGQETPVRLEGYETDSLADLMLGHLEGHVGQAGPDGDYAPFFACLSVQPPHSPYVPPTNPLYPVPSRRPSDIQFRPNVPPVAWVREKAALDLDGYYGMIENLDWNVGRIRQTLKRLGIDRETYLVFFSDHGDMLGSHAQWEKSCPWEESIRIPLIVARVGGGVNLRTGRTDAVINHVDIAPTTLGLCGIPAPGDMVGHDYSPRCIRKGDPAYHGDPDPASEPDSAYLQQIPRKFHAHSINQAWRGVVTRDGWKYVCTPGNDLLLHNLNDDPYELANLAHDSAFQPRRARLHDRLRQWIEDTGDAFELPERDLER